jgi:hypothetical protein
MTVYSPSFVAGYTVGSLMAESRRWMSSRCRRRDRRARVVRLNCGKIGKVLGIDVVTYLILGSYLLMYIL